MSLVAPLLLDTCAAIWFADDQSMSTAATEAMHQAFAARTPVFISAITAWEIGLLCSRGRMRFPVSPERWFERVSTTEGIELCALMPGILISSSFLPGELPRDPADRIMAATAREHGYRLVTRDRPLLAYAEQGHIQAIAC